jgi:uncharacterized protein YdhG (YjbR/CyaY superfamily)
MPAKKFKSVKEYLSSLPVSARKKATQFRNTVKKLLPNAEEMISYNTPAFKLNGKGLIWYAVWKEHLSVYPLSAKMESEIKGLSKYKAAKSTIKFDANKPLPLGLINKIIKFKAKENSEKLKSNG